MSRYPGNPQKTLTKSGVPIAKSLVAVDFMHFAISSPFVRFVGVWQSQTESRSRLGDPRMELILETLKFRSAMSALAKYPSSLDRRDCSARAGPPMDTSWLHSRRTREN
jgi:hypothetical protein